MTKNKLVLALSLIGILGFLANALNAFAIIDISPWVEAFTFIIIGGALFMIAGGVALFNIFQDGKVDNQELMRLITAFIGLMGVIVGLPLLPIGFMQGLNVPAIEGVRGVISLFAMIFIAVEMFFRVE